MLQFFLAKRRVIRALPLLAGLTLSACGGDDGEGASDSDKAEPDAGKRPDASKPDAGRDAGRKDAGAVVPKSDAGTGNPKLDALAGRYLIRFDVLGSASSPSPLGGDDVKINSRVSTLIVAELSADGDHLTARERVCTQDVLQKCESVCSKATTVVDPRVINNFLASREQHRAYTLSDDGTFSGELSVAELGYDDEDEDAKAPTDASDPRVWELDSSHVGGEGFLSKLSVTVGITISCDAYAVQKFLSTFSGKLGGTDDAPEIPQMVLTLDNSEGNRLGSSNTACDTPNAMNQVDRAKTNARMIRYADLDDDLACPAVDVFNEQLPPTDLQ